MTTTATKPRKPKNKPAPRVLEVAVPMPSYAGLVDELGIDPAAVLSDYDREREDAVWQPWSLRGAWEVVTGRSDWTDWTLADARALRELTDEPEPLTESAATGDQVDVDVMALARDQARRASLPTDDQIVGERTTLLGLLDDLTTEIPMPDFPTEVIR